MFSNRSKWVALAILSGGVLLQSSCNTQAILSTIAFAFDIVNIWV